MKKKMMFVYIIVFIVMFSITIYPNIVYGSSPAISAMSGMKDGTISDASATGKLKPVINAVIGLIQITGTGLSLIMVTILGIKYILSAPSDKADVKKQITPMVVGCVILFASVNLVQIIADFATKTLSTAAG